MEENYQNQGYGQTIAKAQQQVQSQIVKNAKIHGYKLAKASAKTFLMAGKALMHQGAEVISQMFKSK